MFAISTLLTLALAAAPLPHQEQVAPGIWAAGFSAKSNSANCGWLISGSATILIDLPRVSDLPAFLSEVAKSTGKPVRQVLLTNPADAVNPIMKALQAAGVQPIESLPGLTAIPYPGGTALYAARQRVLFAGPAATNGPHVKVAGVNTVAAIDTLAKLEKLGAAKVIPGFGSWGDNSILTRQRNFLTELRRQIAYHIAMGRYLTFIEAEVRLPSAYYVWMPYDDLRPEDIRHVYSDLTHPNAPYHGQPPSKSDGKVHALVLLGDRYHEPGHLQEGLQPVFDATGVTPHYLHDVRGLTAENLSRVSLFVVLRDGMNWPDGPSQANQIWMTPQQEKAVVDFVEQGGSFLNLHNSMGVYPKDGPYLNLVGGRYIGHGPLERFRVEIVDPNHPVTKGVKPFFSADEQHTPPYDEKKLHLLLRNHSDDGKAVAAAGWVYEPGRGRLCHLANGHTREALANPEYQKLMRNAVNWLLRR
jgi:type 1 glutamine amidotransferase